MADKGKGKGKDQAYHPAPASGSTRSKEEPTKKSSRQNLDRFIPNRPDFDNARHKMTEDKKNPAESSPSVEAYQKLLEEALNLDGTSRILTFDKKPPARPAGTIPNDSSTTQQSKSTKSTKQSKSTSSTGRTPEADHDDSFGHDFGRIR